MKSITLKKDLIMPANATRTQETAAILVQWPIRLIYIVLTGYVHLNDTTLRNVPDYDYGQLYEVEFPERLMPEKSLKNSGFDLYHPSYVSGNLSKEAKLHALEIDVEPGDDIYCVFDALMTDKYTVEILFRYNVSLYYEEK